MTVHQKSILTVTLILASGLLMWPAGILMIWGFMLLNGDIPTITNEEKGPPNR